MSFAFRILPIGHGWRGVRDRGTWSSRSRPCFSPMVRQADGRPGRLSARLERWDVLRARPGARRVHRLEPPPLEGTAALLIPVVSDRQHSPLSPRGTMVGTFCTLLRPPGNLEIEREERYACPACLISWCPDVLGAVLVLHAPRPVFRHRHAAPPVPPTAPRAASARRRRPLPRRPEHHLPRCAEHRGLGRAHPSSRGPDRGRVRAVHGSGLAGRPGRRKARRALGQPDGVTA